MTILPVSIKYITEACVLVLMHKYTPGCWLRSYGRKPKIVKYKVTWPTEKIRHLTQRAQIITTV